MLALIIKNENMYTEIHFNGNFHGFIIENNKVHKVEKENLNILNKLKLSKNFIPLGIKDGYNVIYDNETKLYHFFKENKEDINKFWQENSTIETLVSYNMTNFKKSVMRKINILGFTIIVSTLLCNKVYATSFETYDANIDVQPNEIIETSSNEALFETIEYTFENKEEELDSKITSQKILELINSSENLNKEEKALLSNIELINDVVPYYDDAVTSIILQNRLTNISILPYDEDEYMNTTESAGYYDGDNVLHVRNISTNGSLKDNKEAIHIIGHEDIHLLQVNNYFKLLTESSAEIITHEYFLNSSDNSFPYAYSEACKYTKILMEIIGPEAIWDYNFNRGSYNLPYTIKEYLTDEEYNQFTYILSLSPFWDKEELEGGLYEKLDELLGVLYNRKFNEDIKDNELINAIKLDMTYNRPYFRKSLIESKPSYYIKTETLSLDEAVKKYEVKFTKEITIDRRNQNEIYKNLIKNNDYLDLSFKVVDGSYQVEYFNIQNIKDNYINGIVVLNKDNKKINMNIEEAYSKGYVNIENIFLMPITYEEFKKDYKAGEYFANISNGEWIFNYKNQVFIENKYKTRNGEEKSLSLSDAYNKGLIKFACTMVLNEEDYLKLDRNKYKYLDDSVSTNFKYNAKFLGGGYSKSNGKYVGMLTLETESGPKEIEVNEAIKLGLIDIIYYIDREVTLEEYLLNKDNENYKLRFIDTTGIVFLASNTKNNTISILEYKKNYVPSINELLEKTIQK